MYESKNRLTPEQAKERIKQYCAGSEHCHSEVRDKLYGFGLSAKDIEPIIGWLIQEDYLNEERYAQQYAGGHFRMKGWGRLKIRFALKAKGLSEYCIKSGLREIEEEDYERLLEKLARQKWESLKNQNHLVRKQKTRNFLQQKGYEPALIDQVLNRLLKGE